MKTAIEAHRLNRNKCMGTLYWQLNDVWLGPTWSTIDASGSWKAAHYTVADRYKPTILLPSSDGNTFELYVSNDKLEPLGLKVKMRLVAFTGEEIWKKEADVQSSKSSVTRVGEWSMKEMMKNPELKKLSVLDIQLFSSDTVIDKELFYFEKPKDLLLSNMDPEVEVQLKDDYIEVKLESPILLKDVFVSCDVEAEFSENFFDVIPTETTIIKLYPKRLVIPKVELKSLNQFLPKY
jgi:beta-mannosidase